MTNPLRRLIRYRVGPKPKYKFHVKCGRVRKCDNFLTRSECRQCIDIALRYKSFDVRAANVDSLTIKKNSGSMSFCGKDIKGVSEKIEHHVNNNYGMSSCSESHVNIYRPNENFQYHHDALDENQLLVFGPQRIATALVYLNTVDIGGDTVFPALNESVAPVEGKLVFWENVDIDGNIDFDMSHLSNESPEYKYVLVKMFHHII